MDITNIIELDHVSYSYPDGTSALRDISLAIKKGERVVLLGNNGAGKSTLLMMLNGIYKPTQGTCFFDKRAVQYTRNDLFTLRSNVGVVFQEPDNQLFAPTVYEELSFGPLNLKIPVEQVRERIDQVLHMVDMAGVHHKQPHLLSYGQKKLVTIASVLTMQPRVLVLDEPTSGLDPAHAERIIKLLDTLHAAGTTVILSTHDVNFALAWADTVVVMNNGQVVEVGSPLEVFANATLLDRCGLTTPVVLHLFKAIAPRCPATKPPRTVSELTQIITCL
jgi:cobalt/nickel transport system ATP-binding protein